MTSTTPDFVYVFDRDGRFVYANRSLLEVWGVERSARHAASLAANSGTTTWEGVLGQLSGS